MDAKERKRIGRLIQILELFKERNSTIPLQQVITFLRVARTPGIGVTEVAHASQTHIASASRHVQALRGQRGATPPLVAAAYGKDERTKPLLLTEDGRHLLSAVLATSDEAPIAVGPVSVVKGAPVQRRLSNDSHCVTPNRIAWDPFGPI